MKHNTIFKTLSLLMVLAVLFTGFPVFAIAAENEAVQQPLLLPDVISQAEAQERGYVARVTEDEKDLNSLVFQNSDGTKTLRCFSHPVKYTDANGTVKDITLKLNTQADGSFITANNNVISHFSKHLSDGISLQHQDVNVTMVPLQQGNPLGLALEPIPVGTLQNNVVSYPFFTNTKLEYALTYTGFKEEIVVEQYTGQTEYSFLLNTGGLTLVEDGGEYYLADGEGERKANIGQVIIFTADERNNALGSMSHVTVREDQQYILTIHVDADYLADPNTAYPIRIDPTIEINYAASGANAIQDITMNSTAGSNGTSNSLSVGKRATYGISRAVMNFSGINTRLFYAQSQILGVYVELRDILCESEAMTVYCYEYQGVEWYETEGESMCFAPYGDPLSSHVISYANGLEQATNHRYQFDITPIFSRWKAGLSSPFKGVMFKAADTVEQGTTNISKTFASYNRSSYKPSFTMVYTDNFANPFANGDYYIVEKNTGRILEVEGPTTAEGGVMQVWDMHSGSQGKWELTLETSTGYYLIKNKLSNKYMGLEDDLAESGSRVEQTSTITDSTRWDFVPADDGHGYILVPKNGIAAGLALSANNTAVGTNCSIKPSNLPSQYSYWYVLATNTRTNIDVYMDGGYQERYGSAASSRIQNATTRVRQEYAKQFGICLNFSAPSTFTSLADQCYGGAANYDSFCPCFASGCDEEFNSDEGFATHHKNIDSVLRRLPSSNNVVVAFSGHKNCLPDSGHLADCDSACKGKSLPEANRCLIGDYESAESEMATLAHELAHLFGGLHHYTISDSFLPSYELDAFDVYPDLTFYTDCIYGDNRFTENVVSNFVFCQGCYQVISMNKNKYAHN